MAKQEKGAFFQVFITQDNPPGVSVRVESDVYAGYPLTREYLSPLDLVSRVGSERSLGNLKSSIGIATMLVGEVSIFVSTAAITFGRDFGEFDALIKTLYLVTSVGATLGGFIAANDGTVESRQASAILGQVPTMVGHSIAPTPPLA